MSPPTASTPGPAALPIGAATAFYVGMAALAAFVIWLRDGAGWSWAGPHPLRELAVGAAAGAALALAGWALARRWAPAAQLEARLAQAVGAQSLVAVAWLALISGVAEEALFRGALQPWLGLWPTAALFGIVHGFGHRELWVWTVTAFAAGVALGYLYDHLGGLLAPAAAHMTVNLIGLARLSRRPPAHREATPP